MSIDYKFFFSEFKLLSISVGLRLDNVIAHDLRLAQSLSSRFKAI
jgi:hypothetical protein